MKKIRIDNTLIVDYSEEKIEELNNCNNHYEIGYTCGDCGKFMLEDDDNITFVTNNHGNEYPVCDDCINNSELYYYCDDCNTWYDDSVQYYVTEDERIICEHCRYEDYYECDECGAIVHRDDIYYCDDCDRYYCESCWGNHYHEENLLYDYHEFSDWRPQHTDTESDPDFYIGHELEIDGGDLCEEVVSEITSKIPAICMHDGSLGYNGIEIISHPLSYNYMLSQEQNYRDLFSQLTQNYDYKSHNTNTCGLHFHVTRPDDETVNRIILFMETYKDEIITLSRRNTSEIQSWCNFLSDKVETSEKQLKSLDYIKKNKETSTRYMALNLTNSNTIEFRIFKGTLKYETFMACFEFVYNLTRLASNKEIPIEELTWTRVTSTGKFLPQYVTEHNLQTDKPIIDYTTELIIERNKQVGETKKELEKLYKLYINKLNALTKIDNRKTLTLIDTSLLDNYNTYIGCIVRDLKYLQNNVVDIDEYTFSNIKDRVKHLQERSEV